MTEPTEFSLVPDSPRVVDLVRRVPAVAWPFVILAGLQAAVFIANTHGQWSVVLLLLLASDVAWALLPAAVLLGCPDAWRSARGVFIGVLAWSAVSTAYGLVVAAPGAFGVEWSGSAGLWPLDVLAQGGEIAGPAIVALYLARRRGTSTTWPIPLVLAALAATALLCVWQASNAMDWYNVRQQAPWGSQDEWSDRAQVVIRAARPLGFLTLGVLAWFGLSAHRAGEQPRGFWPPIVAGATAVLLGELVAYLLAAGLQTGLVTPDLYLAVGPTLGDLLLALSVAGVVLLLVAFARGMPEDSVDLGDVIGGRPEPAPAAERA